MFWPPEICFAKELYCLLMFSCCTDVLLDSLGTWFYAEIGLYLHFFLDTQEIPVFLEAVKTQKHSF